MNLRQKRREKEDLILFSESLGVILPPHSSVTYVVLRMLLILQGVETDQSCLPINLVPGTRLIQPQERHLPSVMHAVSNIEPRYNKLLYNEVLGIMNDFLYPSKINYVEKDLNIIIENVTLL